MMAIEEMTQLIDKTAQWPYCDNSNVAILMNLLKQWQWWNIVIMTTNLNVILMWKG